MMPGKSPFDEVDEERRQSLDKERQSEADRQQWLRERTAANDALRTLWNDKVVTYLKDIAQRVWGPEKDERDGLAQWRIRTFPEGVSWLLEKRPFSTQKTYGRHDYSTVKRVEFPVLRLEGGEFSFCRSRQSGWSIGSSGEDPYARFPASDDGLRDAVKCLYKESPRETTLYASADSGDKW